MDIKKYQTIIEKTSIFPKDVGLTYCTLGLTGEAGEVAEKVKKLYRDTHITQYESLEDYESSDAHNYEVVKQFKQQVKKELGDVLWYITALSNELGFTLEEVMDENYTKLSKRLSRHVLNGSGDDR